MGERLDQWIERHSRNAAQYARLGYHPRKKREILHRFLLLWLITGAIWQHRGRFSVLRQKDKNCRN